MSSILKYCRPIHPSLPNPSGYLSSRIPAKAIAAANVQVGEQAETGTVFYISRVLNFTMRRIS